MILSNSRHIDLFNPNKRWNGRFILSAGRVLFENCREKTTITIRCGENSVGAFINTSTFFPPPPPHGRKREPTHPFLTMSSKYNDLKSGPTNGPKNGPIVHGSNSPFQF